MKLNDKIVSKTNPDQTATITHAPKGKEWTIEDSIGRTRQKSKSFLKKYYKVVTDVTA